MTDFARRLEAEIPALRRYARALLRDAERADDLVQDCLERALAKQALWRPSGTLRAWLFTVMHNLHANQARGASRRPSELPLERAERHGQAATQIDSVATRQVLAAFERLAADQRQVLLLVAVEGLAYREVAEVLGIPLGTVMSRLARGRERLRRLVDDGAGEPDSSLRRVK